MSFCACAINSHPASLQRRPKADGQVLSNTVMRKKRPLRVVHNNIEACDNSNKAGHPHLTWAGRFLTV